MSGTDPSTGNGTIAAAPSSPAPHAPPVTIAEIRHAADSAAQRAAPDTAPLVDVMRGCARREVRLHEHGFIALIDVMPRLVPEGQTADAAIVQAARVSYGQGTKKVSEDRALIRYLLRHRHTTPFEMVELKFHVSMPIFVARQWVRHRTANVNEYSARYSILPDRFYRPSVDAVRKQSRANRQGGEETFAVGEGQAAAAPDARDSGPAPEREEGARGGGGGTAEQFIQYLADAEAMYHRYRRLVDQGVSREMARIALPVSVYTEWYWKCDLHNTLRFLSLRMDPHAQVEIREYARAMHALLEEIVPVTMEAWRDYELESVRLSRLEVEAIRRKAAGLGSGQIDSDNVREQREWEEKRRLLGL
jgi:thymidylate synthase (FAD)